MLMKINLVQRLETLVKQTNTSHAPAVYLLLSALLGATGFLAGRFMLANTAMGFLCGLGSCLLPFVWLMVKKNLRMKKFDLQLPDALDLIARSLKAGHSFSSGLKLAAENFPDPLGSEFQATINEINFGLPVAEALKNLGKRVDSSDLHFFIIATILQRETGGNLAEITQRIATLIRERFKFEDKVRVLGAEGKLSAAILIVLPFIMFFVILKLSPEYVEVLVKDPIGRKAGYAAVVMMLTGIVVIMRMIRIKI
jgi:tight adherence protein B